MEPSIEEKSERKLQEFEQRREILSNELVKGLEEIKKLLDSTLLGLTEDFNPMMEQTNLYLDNSIQEFRKMSERRKEIIKQREKLAPLFEMLNSSKFYTNIL